MKVISYFWSHIDQARNGENELALGVLLDDVVERIVLKNHRWIFPAEEGLRHSRIFPAQSAKRDREFRFGSDVDFQVGSAIRRMDRSEPFPEITAQSLRHPLAPDDQMQFVFAQVQCGGIEEVLDERRIAGDQVAIARPEQPK